MAAGAELSSFKLPFRLKTRSQSKATAIYYAKREAKMEIVAKVA